MNWRNPSNELPPVNSTVWIMLEPHKERGTLLDSARSIQILCGEVWAFGKYLHVVDNDENGRGSQHYILRGEPDHYEEHVMAWLPLEEMPLPNWRK